MSTLANDRPPAEAVEVLVLLSVPSPERARARRVRAKDAEARDGAGKRDSSTGARDEDNVDTRQAKREKADESSDEEMEIDDEDEQPTQQAPPPPLTCTSPLPSTASQHRLHVSFAQSFHRAYDRAPSLLKITLHKSAARGHRGCTLRTVPTVRLLVIPPETP